MELVEGVIIVFAVSICSFVVHRVYRFAMRGKTYEEAIAEQRNMPLEHLLLGRGKDKNKDKKIKKVGKKAKEKPIEKADVQTKVAPSGSVKGDGVQKNAVLTGSKVEPVTKVSSNASAVKPSPPATISIPPIHSEKHRAVEFGKPEAEFENDQAASQDEGKSKKKKKADKGVKPILLNREEVSPVDTSLIKDEPETPRTVNHFEESKPKDEFLKRKHSEEAGNPVQKSKEKSRASGGDRSALPPPHLEPSEVKTKVSDGEKDHKQEEKAQAGHGSGSTSVPQTASAVVSPPGGEAMAQDDAVQEEVVEVQVAQLTQAAPSNQETKRKKKKNDLLTLQQMAGPGGVNISLLEPLIRKADLSRSEVQNLIDLLLNKQQESATEDSEWTEGRQDPVVKLKKQLAEREKSLADEQEASQQWQVKVRELRTELNGERTRLGTTVRTLEASIEKLTAKLRTESDSHAEEKRSLVAQVQELQSKIAEDRTQHSKVIEQEQQSVAALQQELRGQHAQLDVHLSRLREQHQVETEKMMADISRLQEEVKNHEESQVMLSAELRQAQDKLSTLQASCSSSEEECKKLREMAANADANANNAREMAHRMKEDAQKSCIEREQQVAELKAVTSALKMREAELEAEVRRVKSEAETEKVRLETSLSSAEERARRVEEALVQAEAQRVAGGQVEAELQSSHQRLLQERDAFIQQISEELSYYKTEIPKLSEALEVQKKKNDELRQKNWKAMEALTTTENALKAHLKNSQNIAIEGSQKAIVEEQEGVKQLLQRLFPNVTVESAESHSDWVKRFEALAKEHLSKEVAVEEPVDCQAHQKEIQELQARVSHYLNIVKETESMLSSLQSTVESQELLWKEQLAKKDKELKEVSCERDDLVTTLHELQGTASLGPANPEGTMEVCGVRFALSCIEKSLPAILTETEEKVQKLESRLVTVEDERQELSAHCDNLQKKHCDLEKELTTTLKTVEDLKTEVSSLTSELSRRQEQNDDLSKEVVKLSSLVKIGQASLSQEQMQVKEMEEEIEKLKAQPQNHTATNGPANESSITESFSKEVKSSSNAVSSEFPNVEKRGKSKKKKGGSARN
ncbi:ribosome-binding protein 1-like isoform X2 [Hetaerina americana]|uniref:ribosome-binding protein 1-like isoform X2 n=1 Tax=Hetaerina americana TaxID=62018 RepID=UPI003A7F61CF